MVHKPLIQGVANLRCLRRPALRTPCPASMLVRDGEPRWYNFPLARLDAMARLIHVLLVTPEDKLLHYSIRRIIHP